jgi:pSer/pThr/pTyr-binding forkhead associated (FHA) protein
VDVRLDAASVSRRHARLLVTSGSAQIEDCASKSGTFLHGTRVTSPAALAEGDIIGIGSLILTFRAQPRPDRPRRFNMRVRSRCP